MDYLQVFFMGFVFSFIGSIPPGTLNVTVLQLGLEKNIKVGMRFSLAVAIVEYPYAWIGVQFEYFLSASPLVLDNFQLIAAVVMTLLGIADLWPTRAPVGLAKKFRESGFRRGIILSILNPMAIIYWMGFTAYLKVQGWISLSNMGLVHSYVFGAAVGTFSLLASLIFFAQRLSPYVKGNKWIKITSGLILLGLGMYAWWKYFL